jgi:hypothetical protein
MAIKQGQVLIQAKSVVGTAAVSWQVDTSGDTWDVSGTGLEYSVSQGGIISTRLPSILRLPMVPSPLQHRLINSLRRSTL